MAGLGSMAGDGRNRGCGVDDCVAAKGQAQLGILALSVEQRALDSLGLQGSAYALIFLQVALAGLNIRGALKTRDA